MHRLLFALLLLCALPGVMPGGARALDFRPAMEISEFLYSKTNYLDRGDFGFINDVHFSRDLAYNLINVYPAISISLAEGIDGYLQGDFYMEHHFDDVDSDEADAVLAGAYLSLHNRRTTLEVGIQPVQLGKGRILTDDAPAINLKVDMGDAFINLMAARVLDHSPVYSLTVGYSPGFLEQLSLYGIWFQDENDTLANSLPVIHQLLYEPESEGDLYWIGASAELFIGNALFTMEAAYQTGRLALFNSNNRSEFDVSAFYGELALEANISNKWSAGAFCVVASGDDRFQQSDLTAFISIQSYNPRAAIFFDPDFLQIDDLDRLTFGSGPFGGVIAPGFSVSYAPAENLRIDASAVTFQAHEALEDGSRWFGWEADLALELVLERYFTVYLQAARFWHGDYYEAVLDEDSDPATRLVLGLRAEF